MKYLLLFIYLLPLSGFAQTKQDYQKVMDKFVSYYNNDQVDSVCTLFPGQDKNCFWRHCEPARIKREYGNIISYSYLGVDYKDPDKVTVFKVVYTKKKPKDKPSKTMSFNLSKTMKFGTFRFDTESDGIDELLKNSK